jgi:hypothetical protein
MGRLCQRWGATVALYMGEKIMNNFKPCGLPRPLTAYGNTLALHGVIETQWCMELQTKKWLTRLENKPLKRYENYIIPIRPDPASFSSITIISSLHEP